MKVLVWQWGRRGAGPRFAISLAAALDELPGVEAVLSLSAEAEIQRTAGSFPCLILVPTYRGIRGLALRLLLAPFFVAALAKRLRRVGPDLAVCAMPAPLDLLCLAALRRVGVPVAVIVHDAALHPGDIYPLQMALQRRLMRRAQAVIALSDYVASRLRAQRALRPGVPLVRGIHPPFAFGPATPPRAPGEKLHVLSLGRLLPYKGLDLLADALRQLGHRTAMEVRVVGRGPETDTLAALRTLPGVTVDNRWVPEPELASLIAWADLMVLPYREASQSGIAAAALAAGRRVLSTRVGGLVEQLGDEPLVTLCDPDAASLAAAIAELLERLPGAAPGPAPDAAQAWRGFAQHVLKELQPLLRARTGS